MATFPNSFGPKDWKQFDVLTEYYPHLWRQCYPRRYDHSGKGQYDSPKVVSRAMMDAFISYHLAFTKGTVPGQTEQNEALYAALLAKYMVPTYYISHDLAVALTKTTPAQVLDCAHIQLPFPAAAFMLPLDILNHGDYGPVAYVGYCRMRGGEEVLCPTINPDAKHNMYAPPNTFTFSVFLRTMDGHTLHWTYDEALRLVDLRDEEQIEELQKNYSHDSSFYDAKYQNFNANDIAAMMRAIRLVFNIVLIMTKKPEMVESASLIKRVKGDSGGRIEYWKPHVIGRSYKLRYEAKPGLGGTHQSPEGHWVKGFWREQHYGPQRSLSEDRWIEPYWRGGDAA